MQAGSLATLKDVLERTVLILSRKTKNFFDVGGRGYLERPTSEYLALFLGRDIGLGNRMPFLLSPLVACITQRLGQWEDLANDPRLTDGLRIDTEIMTATGSFADILITSHIVRILIENKIHHVLDNDLAEYETLLQDPFYSGPHLKCVLSVWRQSPAELPAGWVNVTYSELVAMARTREFRKQLPASSQETKWRVFYDEFLDHLAGFEEAEMGLSAEEVAFVESNPELLVQAKRLVDGYPQFLRTALEAKLASEGLLAESTIAGPWGKWWEKIGGVNVTWPRDLPGDTVQLLFGISEGKIDHSCAIILGPAGSGSDIEDDVRRHLKESAAGTLQSCEETRNGDTYLALTPKAHGAAEALELLLDAAKWVSGFRAGGKGLV